MLRVLWSVKRVALSLCLALLCATPVPLPIAASDDALFVVIVNGKRGYIDRAGKMIIEPRFAGASPFSEGLALVATEGPGFYKEGYIDKTGRMVIDARFDRATDFSEGLAAVGVGEFGLHDSGDHHWGFIDPLGQMIIASQFRDVRPFSGGLAAARNDEQLWGFIDRTGRVTVPFRYSEALSFSEGLAPVMIEGKWGYVDAAGKVAIPVQYTQAAPHSDGLALVREGGKGVRPGAVVSGPLGGRYLFVDRTGKAIIELDRKVEGVRSFSEGLAGIDIGGRSGFIDKTGKVAIPPRFCCQPSFSDEHAIVILRNGGIGFIDKTGKVVLQPKFAMASNFENGLASVSDSLDIMSAKYGYIDVKGRLVWGPSK